ncbi:transcobalamin-2 [Rhinatrema bivittatum]|uniref:transcobalamin-2 n=1 Tax=Rhinatrema bivittatum TaxID=194408 RepID=UPI001129B545|nr:transcobalamin-2 [Rhinatrema bivittatum]XP_029426788.1 transcobalamin-2 [Rhinatrema bivittatum]
MGQWWLVWVLSFQALSVLVQSCDIPVDNARLIQSLNLKLLRVTDDASEKVNPSVYLGLRLAEVHNLEREAKYLQRLRAAFQPALSSSTYSVEEESSTGLLALYILALRASCEDMENIQIKKLITQLKRQLHEEKKQIVMEGFPLSNYYQYGLGVLSLCINHKRIDPHVIQKLLTAQQNKFSYSDGTSVDTEAVAGLAFLCLERSNLYTAELVAKFSQAVGAVEERILQHQMPEGTLGNVYSTPLAVQFLSALASNDNEMECSKAINVLVDSVNQGHFSNPMPISQLLPVLYRKTYLDIAKLNCKDEQDTLELGPARSGSKAIIPEEGRIQIRLSIEDDSSLSMGYSRLLHVRAGSSLLDVMKMAQKAEAADFTFETEDTLSGPFLIAVNGVKATVAERTYWQLIKKPDISLMEGIADYTPIDGEHIVLKLAKW